MATITQEQSLAVAHNMVLDLLTDGVDYIDISEALGDTDEDDWNAINSSANTILDYLVAAVVNEEYV